MSRRAAVLRGLTTAALFVAACGRALGRPIQVVETHPTANGLTDGHPGQCFIRFAAPVDHYKARMLITQGAQVVHVLHPRLDAAPELLFAFCPALPPGTYELRWAVTSLTDGEDSEGAVAFTVRP